MYAKRLIINLMLCCAFENSYAGKAYSNFTKRIFYLTFIIAPLPPWAEHLVPQGSPPLGGALSPPGLSPLGRST